jgi:hypothetical protein
MISLLKAPRKARLPQPQSSPSVMSGFETEADLSLGACPGPLVSHFQIAGLYLPQHNLTRGQFRSLRFAALMV